MGIRRQTDLSTVAFIGALEQTVPAFTGDKGVCPQLSHLVGEPGVVDRRWEPLVQSGCRTGRELVVAWNSLTTEATECAAYLSEATETMFTVQVEAVGEGRTDGSTRGLLSERRDCMRGRVLTRALETHEDQTVRPVLVCPQLDKLSTSWLQDLPGQYSGLSGPVFSEAMCAHLCLPSPACSNFVGEVLTRGAVVDKFGDKVNAATLPGET